MEFTTLSLQPGETVIFPTETFYALGCRADDDTAIRHIYHLKRRNPSQPLLVLASSWAMVESYVTSIEPDHLDVLKTHWPGPLTAIFSLM